MGNFDLSGLGLDNDPELMQMIMRNLAVMQRGFTMQDQANQPFYRAADQAQVDAAGAKQQFEGALAEPDPKVPLGEGAVTRGLSSFAELLSPGKGYGAKGEARVKEREVGLVRRRVERLQMLEKAADETAKRAQQMGDNKLYMQSLKEGEKYAQMAEKIAQTIGGVSQIRAEHKGRMAEIRERNTGAIKEAALKFKQEIMLKFGIDTETATPEQLQLARAAEKKFDAAVNAATQYQKSIGEGLDSDPEEGLRRANALIEAASSDWIDTLKGVRTPTAPAEDPETAVNTDVMQAIKSGYSRNEAMQVLSENENERLGTIDGIDSKLYKKKVRELYTEYERLMNQIKSVDYQIGNYRPTSALQTNLRKRRSILAKQLKNKYGIDLPPLNAGEDYSIETRGFIQ